jgi:hypothetical protein
MQLNMYIQFWLFSLFAPVLDWLETYYDLYCHIYYISQINHFVLISTFVQNSSSYWLFTIIVLISCFLLKHWILYFDIFLIKTRFYCLIFLSLCSLLTNYSIISNTFLYLIILKYFSNFCSFLLLLPYELLAYFVLTELFSRRSFLNLFFFLKF